MHTTLHTVSWSSIVLVTCALLSPLPGRAQDVVVVDAQVAPPPGTQLRCAPGLAPTAEGYCCWPGQSWSAAAQRCEGAPICPAGYVGAGPTCQPDPNRATVQPMTPPPPTTAVPPPAYGATTYAPSYAAPPPQRPVPMVDAGPRLELVAIGAPMFGAGWLGSIIAGVIYAADNGDAPEVTAAFCIPLAGPITGTLLLADTGGLGYDYVDLAASLAVVGTGLQVAGVVLTIIGLATHRRVPATAELAPDVHLAFTGDALRLTY
ncbi:MAG: hypothetical protein AB7S26_00840 [Sandaracinaceae bacterium]